MRIVRISAFLPFALAVQALLTPAFAAETKLLEEQLSATYPLVHLSRFKMAVQQQGTILQVNKPNIGISNNLLAPVVTVYKNGQIQSNGFGEFIKASQSISNFQVGDKVYLLKIEVTKRAVLFNVQACGSCDFSPVNTGFARATVSFVFPKETLEKPDMSGIQQAIADVFTVVPPGAPAQADPGQQLTASAPAQVTEQPAAPASAVQQPPASIEVGETADQVLAVLGPPTRKATAGAKQIYLYKDMKITFQDGRVSDIE